MYFPSLLYEILNCPRSILDHFNDLGAKGRVYQGLAEMEEFWKDCDQMEPLK